MGGRRAGTPERDEIIVQAVSCAPPTFFLDPCFRPSRPSADSLAGPSSGALHLSSYAGAGFHTNGGVPFPTHHDATMLQTSSTPEEDDDGHFNVADRYY